MPGGRFAGALLGFPFMLLACGGRAQLDGDYEKGGAGGASGGTKAGGAPNAGGVPNRGGAPAGGAPNNGGVGAAPAQGGVFIAGGSGSGGGPRAGGGTGAIPNTGGGGKGGWPNAGGGFNPAGGAPAFGGAAGNGGTGGFNCPPCRAPEPGGCYWEQCDRSIGKCVPVALDGQPCDDRDFCTVGEICRAGRCQGGSRNTCGLMADSCSSVTCNPGGWCALSPLPEGTACKTGDLCEVSAVCSLGKCTPRLRDCSSTRLPGPCYAGQCNSATGLCEAIPLSGIPCKNPNDLCSTGGTCFEGRCFAELTLDCSSLETQCTYGECIPSSGACVARNYPDGSPCSASACSQGDVCSSGVCKPGRPVTACVAWDGCCPAGCQAKGDPDCQSSFSFDAINRGWWNSLGDHQSANDNTFTGSLDSSGYNSYFTFDLSGLTGVAQSARLYLEHEAYYGSELSEQISVWDVGTDATTLESSGSRNTSVYNDLQSGSSYGSAVLYASTVGSTLEIVLSPAAIAHINSSRGGFFSVGVHVDTLSGRPTRIGEGVRFSESSEFRVHQLQVDAF